MNLIIKNSKYKNRQIDFLNIDVEVAEYQVMKKFNFKKYKPKLICIEIHEQEAKKSKVYNLLFKNKYKICWKKKYSYIFKKSYMKKFSVHKIY